MHAKRLKELRLEHGYTMEEIGKKLGIKKSSYASYESKYRRPPLERLRQLSQVYDVSVDYILGITDIRKEQHNFRTLLEQKDLHWDGLPLDEEILLQINQILEDAKHRKLHLDKQG
nr:helix-turn-helix transcriptional regulator [Lysinibacillus timonensis]